MKFKYLLVFLLSNLLIQLNAQPPPPPPDCSNYAGVDVFPVNGNEICGDYGSFVDLFVITNGPPIGEFYEIVISGTDGSQGFGEAFDDGFGFAELFPNPVEGCESVEVSFEMTITCPYTGEVLDVVDLGTFTAYPQFIVEVVEPGCGEGENGSATLVAFDGTICDGPIEGIAGMDGDCETQQPGTLIYDFNPFPEVQYCSFNYADEIEVPCTDLEFGCTDATACNFSETAVCDDGSCISIEPCCPRPTTETLPTAFCSGGYNPGNNVCITFDGDITAIDIYDMNINSANGGFGFPVSNDPATNEVCFDIEIFNYYYYDFCAPFDDNFTLNYVCFETGESVNIDLGTVTIYPPPFAFQVFSNPSPECGGAPEIFPPDCGELVIGEIIPPINDCDNLTPGVLNYDIDPGFDLTNAPDCFTAILTGEIPIPPCEEDCPCETVDITGQGSSTATYFGNIIVNGNFVDFFFHQLGDPTTFDIFPFFYGPGAICEPVTYTLEYEIFCAYEYVLLASGTLGDVTIYPDLSLFFPEILEGQPCGAGPIILPTPCGTVITDLEPIPNPQCGEGAEDQIVTWTVDLGFDATDAPDCFDDSFLMGELIVFGCPDNPGDPCFLECLGEGILDENCNCVVEEAPQLEIVGNPPVAACQGEPFQVDINLIGVIPPGQGFDIEVLGQNGFPILNFSVDEFTVFPLTIDLFDFYYNDPCAVREVTFTLTLRCNYDFSIIGTPITIGPVMIYPSPFNYIPFVDPGIPCESEPQIFLNDFCDATLEIIETVPPVDDCDAPQAGYVTYQVVPAFDITNAPACFTDPLSGQASIPPCLIDCPCDGTFCQNVCVDLTATASDLPTEVCPDYGFQYQLDITGQGADFGTYFISTFDSNGGNVGFEVHNPGDPTTLFPFVDTFLIGCEPEEQTYTYQIICPDDGSILASGTIGTVLIYPSPFNFFPNITPSIPCVQDLMITSTCGTVVFDPDPLPVPGCGGMDTEVNWFIDYGFEYPPDCYPFIFEGTEPVFACEGTPGDPCDDGNPCTVEDSLDENCSCIGNGPTITFDSALPQAACSDEPVDVTITVDMIPDPDGLNIVISDPLGFFFDSFQLNPGDPLTNTFQLFPFTFNPCGTQTYDLQIELQCPSNFSTIGTPVPIGTITVFPGIEGYIPLIEPSGICEEEPAIIAPPCGQLAENITSADPIACPAGNDGFVEWTIDPGFDVSEAPDCFDLSLLSGQEPILACSNCCPLVTDVTVADAGPFCTGDITEVCATFDAPFETDGQVTINGIDAVAGEDQICFELDLVNNGCNYEPVQIPFEIICNDDGTISNGLSTGILVAPDPANFQYVIEPGGCGSAPFVGPGNSPCFVIGSPPFIITEPIDGCPPIDGEVEFIIDYFDDNFNPLDIAAFGCEGFETTLLLPQPGCSTCDCPNPVVSVTVSPGVCEGGFDEICIEFEEGDEANAIGTQVQIFGDAGTFASFTISGDGMSTVYCPEFTSGAFVECEPITENFTIDLFCASDGTPLYNGTASTTVYPSLDKFTYEVIPAVDNCPNVADYPEIISTGECDLDIFDVITVDPVDGCPPTPGSLTYSVNYLDGTLFADALNDCLFTEVTAAVEPIPACDTCAGSCEDEISGTVIPPMGCAVNGITVTIYDDMGNVVTTLTTDANGVYDSTPMVYPCGDYTAELTANIPTCYSDANGETGPKPFTIDNDPNNNDTDGTDFEGAVEPPCEDEISGIVIPPTGCAIAGVTVTIYDDMGNVVTNLVTDANGVYNSTPTVYPCGDYTAELTANLPTCYTDANGETGPKPFVIDDDPSNNDTDGTDFIAEEPEPPTCNISVEISEILCDNNETPQDGSDDVVTITVTVTSSGTWTAGDGTTGNDGDTYSFPATLANNTVTMMFSVDGETDCETVFTSIVNDCDVPAIPTLSQWGLIILCLLMMSFGAIQMSSALSLRSS